jgi:hypothetical protein
MMALATAAIGLGASTAANATIIASCSSGASCLNGGTNVNLTTASDVPIGYGTIGIGGSEVDFTSSQGNINLDATGQATITTAVPGAPGLTSLQFELPTSSFSGAIFDLQKGDTSPIWLILTAADPTQSQTIRLDTVTGSNWFYIVADPGVTFTRAVFTTIQDPNCVSNCAAAGAFDSFKQLRIFEGAGATALPEPTTWGLMLLGFGGIGMAMRRRRMPLAQLA